MNRHDEVHAFGQLRDADGTPLIAPGGRIMMEAEAPAEAPPSERPTRPDHPEHPKHPDHPEHPEHPDRPHPRRPPSPRPHGAPAPTL